MFNPSYKIVLMPKCFPEDNVICLGSQLITIVNVLKDFLPDHEWYGADVDAVGKDINKIDLKSFRLNYIGSDFSLIQYCSGIDQFIWGVFVCADSNSFPKNVQGQEVETEDEPFRSIPCTGILLEIRAFDTSYFEIYSDNEKIIDLVHEKFNSSELLCNLKK